MRPQKKTFVEEKRNIEVDDNAKEENIETNSNVEESDRRWATFGQGSDLFCDYWGLPPTMTDKDSDNLITDNKEPEVISVKQNIEARGERLKQRLLIPMDKEEAKTDFMFTTEIKVTVTKDKKEKDSQYNIQEDNVKKEDQDEEDLEQI